jgi:hypothetical protein
MMPNDGCVWTNDGWYKKENDGPMIDQFVQVVDVNLYETPDS